MGNRTAIAILVALYARLVAGRVLKCSRSLVDLQSHNLSRSVVDISPILDTSAGIVSGRPYTLGNALDPLTAGYGLRVRSVPTTNLFLEYSASVLTESRARTYGPSLVSVPSFIPILPDLSVLWHVAPVGNAVSVKNIVLEVVAIDGEQPSKVVEHCDIRVDVDGSASDRVTRGYLQATVQETTLSNNSSHVSTGQLRGSVVADISRVSADGSGVIPSSQVSVKLEPFVDAVMGSREIILDSFSAQTEGGKSGVFRWSEGDSTQKHLKIDFRLTTRMRGDYSDYDTLFIKGMCPRFSFSLSLGLRVHECDTERSYGNSVLRERIGTFPCAYPLLQTSIQNGTWASFYESLSAQTLLSRASNASNSPSVIEVRGRNATRSLVSAWWGAWEMWSLNPYLLRTENSVTLLSKMLTFSDGSENVPPPYTILVTRVSSVDISEAEGAGPVPVHAGVPFNVTIELDSVHDRGLQQQSDFIRVHLDHTDYSVVENSVCWIRDGRPMPLSDCIIRVPEDFSVPNVSGDAVVTIQITSSSDRKGHETTLGFTPSGRMCSGTTLYNTSVKVTVQPDRVKRPERGHIPDKNNDSVRVVSIERVSEASAVVEVPLGTFLGSNQSRGFVYAGCGWEGVSQDVYATRTLIGDDLAKDILSSTRNTFSASQFPVCSTMYPSSAVSKGDSLRRVLDTNNPLQQGGSSSNVFGHNPQQDMSTVRITASLHRPMHFCSNDRGSVVLAGASYNRSWVSNQTHSGVGLVQWSVVVHPFTFVPESYYHSRNASRSAQPSVFYVLLISVFNSTQGGYSQTKAFVKDAGSTQCDGIQRELAGVRDLGDEGGANITTRACDTTLTRFRHSNKTDALNKLHSRKIGGVLVHNIPPKPPGDLRWEDIAMTIVALPEWSLFSVSRVVVRSAELCPVRKDSDFEGLSIYARCSGAMGPVWNECASSKVPGPCDRDGWKQWLAKPSRSHEFRSLDALFGTKLSVYDEDTRRTRYDPFLGTDQSLHHFIMQHDKSVGTHGVLHSSSCAVVHGSPDVSTPSKVCAKPLPRYECPRTDVGSVSGETSFIFSTKLFGTNPDVLFVVSASVLTVRCGGTPAVSNPQGISQIYSHFVGFNTTTLKDRREVGRSVRPNAMVSLNRLVRDLSRIYFPDLETIDTIMDIAARPDARTCQPSTDELTTLGTLRSYFVQHKIVLDPYIHWIRATTSRSRPGRESLLLQYMERSGIHSPGYIDAVGALHVWSISLSSCIHIEVFFDDMERSTERPSTYASKTTLRAKRP